MLLRMASTWRRLAEPAENSESADSEQRRR